MTLFSSFVLYAIIWFMTLFVVLPLRLTTQGESGEVVPGTPESAPANPQMRRRMLITTIAATVVWGIVVAIVLSGVIAIEDVDILYRLTYQ
ncbi:MAG: putative secreted protein [Rhodobacteraceae bacterium HLUCCA12]|nr:MAG: putative secreted protein [Rhodobacteraceae bacterium HLUCCA12]